MNLVGTVSNRLATKEKLMTDESNLPAMLKPASTEEVVAIVCDASSNSRKVKVRSTIPKGLQPTADADNLLLTNMAAVVDYPARDMTITVEAGMTMRHLAQTLEAENQQLPIDAFDQTATVGSIVAADIAGPRQYGYGTMRDYVIGIEAVDGQGRIFHAGGRVVKNVAGYDLCRLMVGSRGMLGVLTQVTFKLKPIPQHSMLRTFRFDDVADFENALERLNTSAATPVMLDFTYASPELVARQADDDCDKTIPYSLHIGVEGTEASCRWQIEQLKQECVGGEEISFGDNEIWSISTYCRSFGYGWNEPLICCLPSKVPIIAAELAAEGYSSVGHAGNGKLFAIDGDASKVRAVCNEVASRHGGIVSEWDTDHPANSKDELTTRLRAAFDPNCVFIS